LIDCDAVLMHTSPESTVSVPVTLTQQLAPEVGRI